MWSTYLTAYITAYLTCTNAQQIKVGGTIILFDKPGIIQVISSGDSCQPSSCGQNAVCTSNHGIISCTCPIGYEGNPSESCIYIDPCYPNPCGINAYCQADGDIPICSCANGYRGDPMVNCTLRDPCQTNPCGLRANCHVFGENNICTCPFEYSGNPLSKCIHDSCIADRYECTNGHCIEETWVCDGENDCTDGADEIGCANDVTTSTLNGTSNVITEAYTKTSYATTELPGNETSTTTAQNTQSDDDPELCDAFDSSTDCLTPIVSKQCKKLCANGDDDPELCDAFDSSTDCLKPIVSTTCKKLCSNAAQLPTDEGASTPP